MASYIKFTLFFMLVVSPSGFAFDITFDQAKTLANRDEGALTEQQKLALILAQATVIRSALSSCLQEGKNSSFAVVVEMDSAGVVRKSWRSQDSRLAVCFQGVVENSRLTPHQNNIGYSSFEIDISPANAAH